ncbi:MAG TPA: SMP-30/gluconolactonase/LRE family protein [Caulobacter sp.]|nr:SMP-30/gluconolactonase/LRE family protein [Caulobacter sp.]
MTFTVEIVGKERCRLGESPVWDGEARVLHWVDSVAPSIWRYDPATGEQSQIPAPQTIGSIVLGRPGELIAGLTDGVYRVQLDTGAFTPIALPKTLAANERFNDGKADRQGRFVTGTMSTGPDAGRVGKLYRFSAEGAWEILPTDPLEISNSTCFSPDGATLYFADSLRHMLWAFSYDAKTSALGDKRDFFETGGFGSAPDGATVDAEGFIWLALVQAQKLVRISPRGRLDRVVESPAPLSSCPAFGGDDLDILYVTSISDSGGRLKSDVDASGRLLAFHGLGVRGIAEARCFL